MAFDFDSRDFGGGGDSAFEIYCDVVGSALLNSDNAEGKAQLAAAKTQEFYPSIYGCEAPSVEALEILFSSALTYNLREEDPRPPQDVIEAAKAAIRAMPLRSDFDYGFDG